METYTKKDFFDPYQEMYTPVLTDLEECPDEPAKGKRWNVPLYLATAWNVRTGAEGGAQAEVESDSVLQGKVQAVEFKGTVKLTELLNVVGTSDAHWNGGALDHQMKQRSAELAKLMQILFWGRGTGMLGVVNSNVVATNTIQCRLPWAWTKLRKNMRIQFYDAETGGNLIVIGTTDNAVKITSIDRQTTGGGPPTTYGGVITVSNNITVNAGSFIFMKGDYGYAPHGIEGLVNDAAGYDDFLTHSRTTYPELESVVDTAAAPRDISEELMRQIADQIYFNGREIDAIRCNAGLINKIAALSTGNRRYNIVMGDYPKYIQGHKEGDLLFAYDKVTTTIKKDPQINAREVYFLSFKDSFYKHTSAELGFLNRGGNILQPVVSAGGGGYDYALQARLYAACNLSNFHPPGNGVGKMFKDKTLAGDA
jgi:hypothetical protein